MAYANFGNLTPPAYDAGPSAGPEPIPLQDEKVSRPIVIILEGFYNYGLNMACISCVFICPEKEEPIFFLCL